MSLAEFEITRERETVVAGLLRQHWRRLRSQTSLERHYYAVSGLVCDLTTGTVERTRLRAALLDPAVCMRATLLLAVVRYAENDGGEWTPR